MKRHLNLLPTGLQRRLLLRRRAREWALRGMILSVLTLVLLGDGLHRMNSASQELQLWQRRAATIESISESNRGLARQIGAIHQRLNKYRDVRADQLGYQLLATVSHSAQETAGDLQIRKLSLNQIAAEPTATTPAPELKAKSQPEPVRKVFVLSLFGVAKSNLQVAQFASALRDSGAFERVDLKSSRGKKEPTEAVQTYQVDCTF
jgi:hypothetical protein